MPLRRASRRSSDTGLPPEAPTEPQSDASDGVEVTTLQIESTITWEADLNFDQGYADALANLVAETVREMCNPRRRPASEQSDDDSYDEDDDEVKEDEDPLGAISRNETIRRLDELVEQEEMMMAELQTTVVDLLVAARRPRLTARRRLVSRRAP